MSLPLLAVGVVVLVLSLALADVAVYLTARFQAGVAADAAALAAAPVTFRPFGAASGPRDEAARFAEANGAVLVKCTCRINRSWSRREVEVIVARQVTLIFAGRRTVRVKAKAVFEPVRLVGG